MNGYKMLADSYREYLEKNEVPEETKSDLLKKIKLMDAIADMDEGDYMILYGMGIFNDITLGYARNAMANLRIPKKTQEAVLSEIRYLHDTMPAERAAG